MKTIQLNRKVMYALLGLNILAFIYYFWFLINKGHLPSPFFYDTSDTFMDLFNPLVQLSRKGIYNEYHSIYPPLNFLILKCLAWITNISRTVDADSLRESSTSLIFIYLAIYLLTPALILRTKSFNVLKLWDKKLLYFIFIFSFPYLFLLERGNILLFSFIPLAMALNPDSTKRELWIAILINLKPYFIFLSLIYLFKKEWNSFFRTAWIASSIFVITGLIIDPQHFILMFGNLVKFSDQDNIFAARGIFSLPSSIDSFFYVIENKEIRLSAYFKTAFQYFYYPFWNFLRVISLAGSLYALFVFSKRLTFSIICLGIILLMLNLSFFSGGYILNIYLILLPFLIKMRFKSIYLACISLMIFPWILLPSVFNDNLDYLNYSFLSHSFVYGAEYKILLGSFIIPLANFVIFLTFNYEIYLAYVAPNTVQHPNN
jgi:hypothetical protein